MRRASSPVDLALGEAGLAGIALDDRLALRVAQDVSRTLASSPAVAVSPSSARATSCGTDVRSIEAVCTGDALIPRLRFLLAARTSRLSSRSGYWLTLGKRRAELRRNWVRTTPALTAVADAASELLGDKSEAFSARPGEQQRSQRGSRGAADRPRLGG